VPGLPANRRFLLICWYFSLAEGIGNRKTIGKRQQVSDVSLIGTISHVGKANSAVEKTNPCRRVTRRFRIFLRDHFHTLPQSHCSQMHKIPRLDGEEKAERSRRSENYLKPQPEFQMSAILARKNEFWSPIRARKFPNVGISSKTQNA
jgi:hypothetical protein